MHPRHPIARLGPATSALMLTVAVASKWIGVGFSDTALVTCGVLDVYAEPVSFSEVGTWWHTSVGAGRFFSICGTLRSRYTASAYIARKRTSWPNCID